MGLKEKLRKCDNRIRAWEGDDPTRKRKTYWRAYTLSFVVVACAALFVYPSNGRSIVWSVDGLEQYYPFFIYEGQWLRDIFSSLFSGQGLQVPLWSYSLGYGSDILSTLDVFFDPLNLLSGLCPEQYSEYLFQFLVVFRLYLAGAAFSAFAMRFKTGRFPTLIAALLYSLCGTALAVGFWPYGAWPLVLFPLLLLGVEKVLAGERPYLFILVAAAFFLISYYFSYMACLFLIPYCAARVILTQRPMTVVRFVKWTLRFFGLLAIGVLIAGISLAPALISLLGNDRFVDANVSVPLLYSFSYYVSFVGGFTSVAEVGSDCYVGFGGLGLLACALLFSRRKEHRLLKVAFIAATIGLLVPAVGSVLNGFNYATNRWAWAYALIVCFIVAKMLPDLMQADKRRVKMLVAVVAVYGLIVFLAPQSRNEKTMAAFAVMLAFLFVISLRDVSLRTKRIGVSLCLVASLTCNAFYFVSPDEGGVGSTSSPLGSLYRKLTTESVNSVVASVDDSGMWRYDGDPTASVRTRNDSVVLGLNGIDFYNSLYNGYIDQYHTELGVAGTFVNFSYKNLGGRSILETLAGVKYYVVPDEASTSSAFNYDDADNLVAQGIVRGQNYLVYEWSDTLPLAFTYDRSITREQYDSMTPLQRQESLLQGVVVEGSSLPAADVAFESTEVSSQIVSAQGLTIEDGVIRVTQAGATLQLSFAGLPDSETYLYVDGLDYTALSPRDLVDDASFEAMSWYQKAFLLKSSLEWKAPNNYTISLTSDKAAGARSIENANSTWHMYGGKDEWLVNMGYSQDAQSTITLRFNQTGEYRYDKLSVACQPMGDIPQQIEKLAADPVENLSFGTNEVTGTVESDDPQAVFFSIPFSKGWTATVDGEPVEVKRANTGFMAVEVGAGKHDIVLSFMTPGLPEGAALTGVGLFALLAVVVAHRVKVKTRERRTALQESEL